MSETFSWLLIALIIWTVIYHPERVRNAVRAGPVAPLTGLWVLYRLYERLITRFAYIALLFYWYIYLSGARLHESHLFSTLFMELARFPRYGERDTMGKHWSTNIAEELSMTAINVLFEPFASNHFWKLSFFNCFLVFFVFGHHLFQLWMQKAVATLARWNHNTWLWRELVIERSIQSLVRKLDSPMTRTIVRSWWSGWYWLYRYLDENRTSSVAIQFLMMRFFLRSTSSATLYSYLLHYLFMWALYGRDLAQFANPNPPDYKYKPLKGPDHIRLLLLHPRFGFRPVSCNLIQGPGMRILFYEAISYTWGTMAATEDIFVDGCKMKVTKSVYEVLASYSSLFLPKLIWIDAVCIDQSNLDEKALQVPLMQRIYKKAEITTVFLGQAPVPNSPAPDHSSVLPYRYDSLLSVHPTQSNFCHDAIAVFDLFREFHVLENQLHRSGSTLYELHEMVRPSKSKPRTWAALQRFLQHPWFLRVWIVQEVALSSYVQVRFGGETIEWEIMGEAIKRLQSSRNFRLWLEWEHGIQLRHMQYTSMYNIVRIDNMREKLHPREQYGWPEHISMADVLRESFFFQATNPRDQIYGMMALCKPTAELQVDYRAAVEDTYIDAAVQLLNLESIRTVLHAAGLGNRLQRTQNLPSWVPDWREAPKYDMINTHNKPLYLLPEGDRKNKKTPSFQVRDKKVLIMSTTYIDTIEELGPIIFEASSDSKGPLDELDRLAKSWQDSKAILATSPSLSDVYAFDTPGQTIEEAFKRTMLCDQQYIDFSSTDKFLPKVDTWEAILLRMGERPQNPTRSTQKLMYDTLLKMDQVTAKVESCCGGRRMFVTKNGYIGLCPPYTSKGDLLHAVPNLGVALLLRKSTIWFERKEDGSESRKQFSFVGEAYCHGSTNRNGPWNGRLEEVEII